MKRISWFVVVLLAWNLALGRVWADPPADVQKFVQEKADEAKAAGNAAWMLISTGLVLLMVPGLALFYGGMVRRKNLLGTMMQSMVALGIVGVLWIAYGYSMAFGTSIGGWVGWSSDLFFLNNLIEKSPGGIWQHKVFPGTDLPIILHCMYQGMFAIITPALISGALAERIKFGPYCLFLILWSTLIYCPLAHWVWSVEWTKNATTGNYDPAGWLAKMGAIDFAGGTVVHVAAGFSALGAILALRKRLGYPEHAMHPNSMVLTLLGAGILWFGWFGFNGGSALNSSPLSAAALGASQIAAAAAAVSWMVAEWLYKGKPTALGFASGLVAGLVAITPASGYVTPVSALVIGVIAGLLCYGIVCLKPMLKYDDSLDAFGVHGVGGFLGAVLTGVFASRIYYSAGTGSDSDLGKLLKDGSGTQMDQIMVQLIAAVAAALVSFIGTIVLVKIVDIVCGGFCLDARDENQGLDQAAHGEVGFEFGPAIEPAIDQSTIEPRHADLPPDAAERFTVTVEGAPQDKLIHVWSSLCQTGPKPPDSEFLTVYPYLTTVSGNQFRFRGGDPRQMREALQLLFQKHIGLDIRATVENGNPKKYNNGQSRVPAIN